MATWYRELSPIQPPIGIASDENNRAQIVFNVQAVKEPSLTFLEELVKLLVTAAVGVFNTNIFAGTMAQIPAEGGPYLQLIENGGGPPLRIQNDLSGYDRPTAQVRVVAPNYVDARLMARNAYVALNIRNQSVTP
jgi:hypothetical protein